MCSFSHRTHGVGPCECACKYGNACVLLCTGHAMHVESLPRLAQGHAAVHCTIHFVNDSAMSAACPCKCQRCRHCRKSGSLHSSWGATRQRRFSVQVFLAVDVCRGRPTDVYAMGACLYTFVLGRIPFTAGSVQELFQVVIRDPLSFPAHPHTSGQLRHLLRCMMEKVIPSITPSRPTLTFGKPMKRWDGKRRFFGCIQ